MMIRTFALAGLLAFAIAAPAAGKDKAAPAPPQAYQAMIACRAIVADTDRLACFDRQVATMEKATAAGELVISDKATVREARRGLFGFKLPSLKLFGGGDDDDEIKQIETTIASASRFGYGSWRLTLKDGSVWEQTDSQQLVIDPRSGNPVKIRNAALGTFFANIDGQKAIRMRRVQ